MRLMADCHFHTVSSGHAYSTLDEYAREASMKGLELIAITDHGPAMPGGAHVYHFHNLKVIPDYLYEVEILKGMEANIIGMDGSLDTDKLDPSELDVLIASFHLPCLKPGTIQENTRVLIRAMENKYVNMIGHPDDSRIPLDYDVLAQAAAANDVLLEINNSSLKHNSYRINAEDNYVRLLEGCVKHKASVIVNSDSHIHTDIGEFGEALFMLRKMGFPKELIANANVERLKKKLVSRRG